MKLRAYIEREVGSAAQMARILDCSESMVHRWLSGQSLPSLEAMAKIQKATGGAVLISDFVDEPDLRAIEARSAGRPIIGPIHIEQWLRSKGLRACGLLVAQVPGGPSRPRIQRYMVGLTLLPRWTIQGTGARPSLWVAPSALDVSDSFRIVTALRDRPPIPYFYVEREGNP
tara:strand:- start:561 stop:1076 length:516 start_codon:yes stop_codon:yes gene_type:complete